MTGIFLNDVAKEQLFESVFKAENDYIKALRKGFEDSDEPTETEVYFCGIYKALYLLCKRLGQEKAYIVWRNSLFNESE